MEETRLEPFRNSDGIVRFTREVLRADPAPYQEKILRALVEHRRVAVHGPHGLGKTAVAAWFTLWFMVVHPRDVKVVTTASAWRQLTHYLWPEIRKWAQIGNWHVIGLDLRDGKELLERSIRLPGAKEAFPVASDNPASIEGAHAAHIAYVFDEAKVIPVPTWDAAEGAFSTGDSFALAISTPGEQSGRFYDICTRRVGLGHWHVIHVTLEEAIAAGRVAREWAELCRSQWGETSDVYKQRVLGEFADSTERQVIPLSWIDAAVERWLMAEGKGPADAPAIIGVDPAYTGADKTAVATLRGAVIEKIDALAHRDTMETAGYVRARLLNEPGSRAYIDIIGIGAGVFDRLDEQQNRVSTVDARRKTNRRDSTGLYRFRNLRSFLWWNGRERLDPNGENPVALPPDNELIGDLTAPTFEYHSTGDIVVEEKEKVSARIGRSTDRADAVLLALYADSAPPLAFYEPLEW